MHNNYLPWGNPKQGIENVLVGEVKLVFELCKNPPDMTSEVNIVRIDCYYSLPDWAGEAATREAPHPRHVHEDDAGIEAHARGTVAGQLLQHTVHILHRRHPHDLVWREHAAMNDLESFDNNNG